MVWKQHKATHEKWPWIYGLTTLCIIYDTHMHGNCPLNTPQTKMSFRVKTMNIHTSQVTVCRLARSLARCMLPQVVYGCHNSRTQRNRAPRAAAGWANPPPPATRWRKWITYLTLSLPHSVAYTCRRHAQEPWSQQRYSNCVDGSYCSLTADPNPPQCLKKWQVDSLVW